MPGRSVGNARESSVCDALDALGYFVISLKGSGARGARMRRRANAVVGDLLAIRSRESSPFYPWLQIEVGAHGPTAAFKELRTHPLPGFTPILIQYHYPLVGKPTGQKRARSKVARRRVWVDESTWFPSLGEALVEMQARR